MPPEADVKEIVAENATLPELKSVPTPLYGTVAIAQPAEFIQQLTTFGKAIDPQFAQLAMAVMMAPSVGIDLSKPAGLILPRKARGENPHILVVVSVSDMQLLKNQLPPEMKYRSIGNFTILGEEAALVAGIEHAKKFVATPFPNVPTAVMYKAAFEEMSKEFGKEVSGGVGRTSPEEQLARTLSNTADDAEKLTIEVLFDKTAANVKLKLDLLSLAKSGMHQFFEKQKPASPLAVPVLGAGDEMVVAWRMAGMKDYPDFAKAISNLSGSQMKGFSAEDVQAVFDGATAGTTSLDKSVAVYEVANATNVIARVTPKLDTSDRPCQYDAKGKVKLSKSYGGLIKTQKYKLTSKQPGCKNARQNIDVSWGAYGDYLLFGENDSLKKQIKSIRYKKGTTSGALSKIWNEAKSTKESMIGYIKPSVFLKNANAEKKDLAAASKAAPMRIGVKFEQQTATMTLESSADSLKLLVDGMKAASNNSAQLTVEDKAKYQMPTN